MASVIRVNEKWRAQVRRRGFPPRTRTFTSKILADKWARAVEAEIDAGRVGLAPKGGTRLTVLIDRYNKEIGHTKPFGRGKKDAIAKLDLHLGQEDVFDLTAERIVRYVLKDRKIRDVTAGIELTYLKGILKVARALWRVQVPPGVVDDAREMLKFMGMLNRSNERDRRPTDDELARISAWLDERSVTLTRDHIEFILDSCFRPPSEIVRLRRSDLNETDRTILIRDRKDPRKKIGNNQTVPLLGRCMAIIERQQRVEGEDLIFPVNGVSWTTIFPRACRELGIKDLHLYDLRHEAISRLVESGKYSIPEVMLVSGHKDPKQMMRYTQLRAKNLHR